MNQDHLHTKTATAQKVMDRIKEENRWVLPVHEHEKELSSFWRTVSVSFIILFLLGISISIIFLKPTVNDEVFPSSTTENTVTVIRSTDFAKTYSNLSFSVVQEGVVAGIGEPNVYQPDGNRRNKIQLLWMLVILGGSMITLFLNWLSREKND